MPTQQFPSLVGIVSALALVLGLGGCTPGGQFDPTEVLSADIFNTKKTIQGDREPLFPNGVPGAETGVPPDLIKGYQPPPEQAENSDAAVQPAPTPAKPKPKPKPKPALAHTPPQGVPPQQPAAQMNWPPPPSAGQAQQAAPVAPTNWPAPPPAAQTNWPAPPSTGQAQAAPGAQTNWPAPPPGQAQQTAQPGQSSWPSPPAPGTYSR